RSTRLLERGWTKRRGAAARQAYLAGSDLPVHDVRVMRVSMPGGNPASPGNHRHAARRYEHRQMGGRLRQQVVPEPRTQWQSARLLIERTREVRHQTAVADL